MTAALLAAVFFAVLPEGSARWRFELSGEHVGVVELAVSCAGEACVAGWRSERLAPAEAGGRRSSRRVEVEVDREGRWRGGRVRVTEDGRAIRAAGVHGAVPAILAEVVLAGRMAIRPAGLPPIAPGDHELCLEAFEEGTGARGAACARREGAALEASVLGEAETIAPGKDGFPLVIAIPRQGARFVRDDAGNAPQTPPRLHGVAVAGPRDPERAVAFCGVPRDPPPAALDVSSLPAPRAQGRDCREKSAAWLAAAARAGVSGRTAIGVAWDGARFVWHAWAEVRLGGRWLPVDPSFEELPARGPRFTLAVYAPGDAEARRRAGERILACWGRERVEDR
jgi:hypothetical protein